MVGVTNSLDLFFHCVTKWLFVQYEITKAEIILSNYQAHTL